MKCLRCGGVVYKLHLCDDLINVDRSVSDQARLSLHKYVSELIEKHNKLIDELESAKKIINDLQNNKKPPSL